jgi:hypothetical protein
MPRSEGASRSPSRCLAAAVPVLPRHAGACGEPEPLQSSGTAAPEGAAANNKLSITTMLPMPRQPTVTYCLHCQPHPQVPPLRLRGRAYPRSLLRRHLGQPLRRLTATAHAPRHGAGSCWPCIRGSADAGLLLCRLPHAVSAELPMSPYGLKQAGKPSHAYLCKSLREVGCTSPRTAP